MNRLSSESPDRFTDFEGTITAIAICVRTSTPVVGVLDHEDLVPVDSVHLGKVCLVVLRLPLTVELECPPHSEAVVASHTAL